MGVEDPGMLKVTCDECGEEEDFDTTQYADNTFGVDSATLEANKWSSTVGGETYCESCTKEIEEGEDDD